MARPGLFTHRKFRKLARLLGSDALAVGHLELIWHAGYQDGDPLLGGSKEVEATARWQGKPGQLTRALKSSGFIDSTNGVLYSIHDLFDNAPDYVRKRRERESKRRESVRSLTGQSLVTDRTLTGTPVPSHPIPSEELTTSSNPPPADVDVLASKVKPRKRNGHTPERSAELDRWFLAFYADYPRHEGKQAAIKAFLRLNPDRSTLLAISADVNRRVDSGVWVPEDPDRYKFIPLPASYLNGKRWEDSDVA